MLPPAKNKSEQIQACRHTSSQGLVRVDAGLAGVIEQLCTLDTSACLINNDLQPAY